jgi:hypothetical protein
MRCLRRLRRSRKRAVFVSIQTRLTQLTYREFGGLRFLDWFLKTKKYCLDTVGGYQTVVGLGKVEGYLGSVEFIAKREQTVMVAIEFGHLSAADIKRVHKLLDHLGLPLRRGTKKVEIESVLGQPNNVKGWPKSVLARGGSWVLGEKQQYIVDCNVDPKQGLYSLSIYRKDLADKEDRL